ncbi:MAG: family 43 glycosylhydrolase [Opitutales bacterium]|nr:family 43 glycosylhydrolase [Opitutales bacterium]
MIFNPVLRGFHPDPSWVRVGEWTYLVTSTFAWLPGLPVYRSRDLCQWDPLPPVIPDNTVLDFRGLACDDGLYAPGIRHDGRRFLLTCTLVDRRKQRFVNFVCTSVDPAEGWSRPVLLPESIGRIDPTPFVDEDGSLWLVLNDLPVAEHAHGGTRSIQLWKLDTETFQPIKGPYLLWHGSMVGAATAEAPRLFRKDGWYWLMIAEGGTGPNHSVTMARSREITGPYASCPANPLLTHRHLGRREPIQCVGHADLMQRADGSWWACCLAERRVEGCRLLGRETWLLPVAWEGSDWPLFAPGQGRLSSTVDFPGNPSAPPQPKNQWLSLRTAPESLTEEVHSEKPFLRAQPHAWDDTEQAPALIGQRIREHEGRWRVELTPEAGVTAYGIAIFCNDQEWLSLGISGGKLSLMNAKGNLFGSGDIPPSGPAVMELLWNPVSVSARVRVGDIQLSFPDAAPMNGFAHPGFAGGVLAVWARGTEGGVFYSSP